MKDDALDLLASAKDVLTIHDEATQGLWPRASALLGRQALEISMERLWSRVADGLQRTPMRCQLLSLPRPPRMRRPSRKVVVSSRACHHQPYDLGPTHQELDGWLSDVWELATVVERRCE